MKKKILALTAAVVLAGVVMAGCGSKNKEIEAQTETTALTETTEADTTAETVIDTEKETDEETDVKTTEAAE